MTKNIFSAGHEKNGHGLKSSKPDAGAQDAGYLQNHHDK